MKKESMYEIKPSRFGYHSVHHKNHGEILSPTTPDLAKKAIKNYEKRDKKQEKFINKGKSSALNKLKNK